MQNQKGLTTIWIVLIVIICLILGGLGGYYYFKSQEKQTSVAPKVAKTSASTTVSPTTSTSVTDETADWKTYTNDKYGFSFKYPQIKKEGWKSVLIENETFLDENGNDYEFVAFTYARSNEGRELLPDEEKIIFSYLSNQQLLLLRELAQNDVKTENENNIDKINILSEKEISVNVVNGYYIQTKGGPFNSTVVNIYLPLDKGILKIINVDSEEYFNKILSTLKIN